MADDVAQAVGKTKAQLLFFAEREETENTVDRLAGIDRVQRAQNEVAGFRGHQRDFDGGAVAHFADENDFRRLAQRGAQAVRIIVKIVSEFALVEGGLARRMHELDRILQRDDVHRLRFVDLVEDRGQGGRLAAAGRAGDEDETRFFPSRSL